jgi:hypothetical protein
VAVSCQAASSPFHFAAMFIGVAPCGGIGR